jgi:TonB family protein
VSAGPAQGPSPEYRDNASGLEKFAHDVMKAQKENNGTRADELLRTMVLPNSEDWYRENLDDEAADMVVPQYAANSKTLPMQLANFFLQAQQQHTTNLQATRFEKSCDDNASEQTFNVLDARLKGVPLYELRLFNGNRFLRLFAFAYVDGAFRYILTPNFADSGPSAPVLRGGAKPTKPNAPQVKQGATVQAAKIISKVQPLYPDIARAERLGGTVRLHAIIATDGTVKILRVLSGRCSLARAAVDAVRKWRYAPTLINGEPVEVITTVDVIFQMRN